MGRKNGETLKCDYCGTEFYLKKSHAEQKYKHRYCSMECQGKHKTILTIEKYKNALNICDMESWLIQKYLTENKGFGEIQKILQTKNNRIIPKMFKYYNIPIRNASERVHLQWVGEDATERKQWQTNHAKTVLKSKDSRDKLNEVMQTKEVKDKISKANSGKNNGMYGIRGELHVGWNPNKTRLQRQKDRKLPENTRWRISVFKRDNYTCMCCGKQNYRLNAHHLNGYTWNIEGRFKVDNGITLCVDCHKLFHHLYGVSHSTNEQFKEFIKQYGYEIFQKAE